MNMIRAICAAVACGVMTCATVAGDVPFPSKIPGCGIKATGDCWEANDTPGCDWTPCCETICEEFEPFCCDESSTWDAICQFYAEALCDPLPLCETAKGPCDEASDQRGCGEKSCCYLTCALDSFCCDTRWDRVCAEMAVALCDAPLCPLPGKATNFEIEKCDERTNDGCNDPEGLFTAIACGQRWYGEVHAAIRRDADWYRIDLAESRTLMVELHAEFAAEVFIASGACEDGYLVEAIGVAGPCQPVTISAAPPAGIVWIVVAPATQQGAIFTGMPCEDDPPPWNPVLPRGYEFSLTCR